ncbi:MAG: SEC-C domain-containing protein [Bacteroidales bacterium]|jgi:hypothetical protein|nr:SEC-C domain-containing protein [Bacteroidales bacterium]
MKNTEINAFTLESKSNVFRSIISDVGVSVPNGNGAICQTKALWDTGATNCVITKNTAQLLCLEPIGFTKVIHAGGDSIFNEYLINLHLPNKIDIPNIKVTECSDTSGQFGVIIGMEVITLGDFALTNVKGISTFSYRIPSIATINYVSDNKIMKENQLKQIGRNKKCPCGSGKKAKDCCYK